jgi:hypothetical protein
MFIYYNRINWKLKEINITINYMTYGQLNEVC